MMKLWFVDFRLELDISRGIDVGLNFGLGDAIALPEPL